MKIFTDNDFIMNLEDVVKTEYRVIYTTDYFEYLKREYKNCFLPFSLRDFHNEMIKENGCLVNVVENIIKDGDTGKINESTFEMMDDDCVLFESNDKLIAVRLVINTDYLDLWIKKYDLNNYILEINRS
ncbi:hypothetical protein [Klebsiella pneumoniae]|uniref:hypothetical protein n=1 Tax=Klebsiella pneumoniae TaxID=573 RepID=UPI002961F781|nr:hypothetical protein [Klebsiella pneumoniae]MDW1257588.1 hypothetical protein [Klebsiella pneumoniae]